MASPTRIARRPRIGTYVARCSAALAISFAALGAAAQPPPLDLPGERREELPIPETEPEVILPPLPPSATQPPPVLTTSIRSIRLVGNTVLDEDVLREVADRYVGRRLSSEDVRSLRDDLTRLYVDAGYVTSGARIPDQDLRDGVLVIQLVEGKLAELRVSGGKRFRDSYLRSRIAPDPDEPINATELEARLQLLQSDPQIQTVHAELRPGHAPDESLLLVRIVEARGFSLYGDFNNERSPAIGGNNGRIRGSLRNLTGWGDLATGGGQFSSGLMDVQGRYVVPVSRRDTRAGARLRWSRSQVVEEPFRRLDIESDFLAVGLELTHFVYRDRRNEVEVGALAEWRRGRNFVAGEGFSFAEGADRGVSQVVPLRLHADWVHRLQSSVLALRAMVSIGLPILGATAVDGAAADAQFVTLLLQAQAARRFDELLGLEAIVRADAQISNDALLPIEQFSIGGHSTVRGYRENTAVRDNGWAATLEARLPILGNPDGTPILQLAPFVDAGRVWDSKNRTQFSARDLVSVGLGLRWSPKDWLRTEVYWGRGLMDSEEPIESSLQDHGVYFRITAGAL